MTIENKIIDYSNLAEQSRKWHKAGKLIVFVHGVFDLLHKGHVMLLANAKKQGDVLLVGVEPDFNTQIIKGKNRPIHDEQARIVVLSYLQPIDYLFLIPEYPANCIAEQFYSDIYRCVLPDVVATSIKAGKHGLLKKQHAENVGARFVDINSLYPKNTTHTLNLLKDH